MSWSSRRTDRPHVRGHHDDDEEERSMLHSDTSTESLELHAANKVEPGYVDDIEGGGDGHSNRRAAASSWRAKSSTRNWKSFSYRYIALPVTAASAILVVILFTDNVPSWSSPRLPGMTSWIPSTESMRAQYRTSHTFAGLNPDFSISYNDIVTLNTTISLEHLTPQDDMRNITFAEVSAPTELQYRGIECRSHYPGPVCPFPGQCAPADSENEGAMKAVNANGPCLHWKSGKLPYPIDITKEQVDAARYTPVKDTVNWDVEGKWDGDTWTPHSYHPMPRSYKFFSPQDAMRCLAGKRVLIQGDSIMRQVANRLIQYIREIPASAEHFYHFNTLYTLHIDGTDDWQWDSRAQPWENNRQRDSDDDVLTRIFFSWRPGPNDVEEIVNEWATSDVDLVVAGFNYWYPLTFDNNIIPQVINGMYKRTGWDGHLAWYPTPENNGGPERWWYAGRNGQMRAFAEDRIWREGKKISIIPSDRISHQADDMRRPQRNCPPRAVPGCEADLHFGCMFMSAEHEPIIPGLKGMKVQVGFDCRDTYNLAVVQNILNSFCST